MFGLTGVARVARRIRLDQTLEGKNHISVLTFRSEKVIPALSFIAIGLFGLTVTSWTLRQAFDFRQEAYAYNCNVAKFSDEINYGVAGT